MYHVAHPTHENKHQHKKSRNTKWPFFLQPNFRGMPSRGGVIHQPGLGIPQTPHILRETFHGSGSSQGNPSRSARFENLLTRPDPTRPDPTRPDPTRPERSRPERSRPVPSRPVPLRPVPSRAIFKHIFTQPHST